MMNSRRYYYSVLRYRHSYLLNEVVNIGLLIILPEENKIQFFFPRALERLSSLYQDLSVSQIKKYLKAFKRKSEELNEGFEELVNKYEGFKDYHSVKRIIKNYFLIQDASSLYFGDVKSGLDGHSIVKEIKELYFSPYSKPTRISRKDENYLEDTFIKGLSQKVFNKTKYDKYTNRNFKVSSGIITQEFPFAWKNGHTNIITPIAFDLKNPKIIENKYTSWFGKLTLLENTAQQKDFQFDLLISKPTLKVSPELNNAYLNGVEVLGSLKTRKRIILEEDFENYIAQAAKEINAQNSSQ